MSDHRGAIDHPVFCEPHNLEVVSKLRDAGVHWPESEGMQQAAGIYRQDAGADRYLPTLTRDAARKIEAAGGKVAVGVEENRLRGAARKPAASW